MSGKGECAVCKKQFTTRTLEKHGGSCGRCVSNSLMNVTNVVHGPVEVTKTQQKKLWGKYKDQIEQNNGLCLLCNKHEITMKSMRVGYDKSRIIGGQLTFDNCMPICYVCSNNQNNYSFDEYKAIQRVVVPPKCVLCKKPQFKYIYKCCRIKACDECVKNNDKLFDGFAVLNCPKCKKEVSITNAMVY